MSETPVLSNVTVDTMSGFVLGMVLDKANHIAVLCCILSLLQLGAVRFILVLCQFLFRSRQEQLLSHGSTSLTTAFAFHEPCTWLHQP